MRDVTDHIEFLKQAKLAECETCSCGRNDYCEMYMQALKDVTEGKTMSVEVTSTAPVTLRDTISNSMHYLREELQSFRKGLYLFEQLNDQQPLKNKTYKEVKSKYKAHIEILKNHIARNEKRLKE